jgi:hypothetical protein
MNTLLWANVINCFTRFLFLEDLDDLGFCEFITFHMDRLNPILFRFTHCLKNWGPYNITTLLSKLMTKQNPTVISYLFL